MKRIILNDGTTIVHETSGSDHKQFQLLPNPDLSALERLVGTWEISGGVEGTVTYEWMEGKFFMLQHVHLTQHGQDIRGLEVIGHLHPFGEEPSKEIRSRYYDTMGNTFDYVYELEGDTLRIWAGEKGSTSYFTGTFTKDGNANHGTWIYSDGNGYASSMIRVKQGGMTK